MILRKAMLNSAQKSRALCEVVLPNKMQHHITVGIKSRGQDIISQLTQLLGIPNLHLFGLSFQKDKDHLFLDLEKKLTTYFPKPWKKNTLQDRMVLYLRVQYYVRNGHQIVDEKVLSLYYADLKNRVLCSQCYGQEGVYFQLAANALQADLGDWKAGKEPYFSPQDYFPPWILIKRGCDYVVQHTPDLHRELSGMTVHNASLLFIEEASSLGDVPLTFYSMTKAKRDKRVSVLLGLASTGLHIYDIERASGEYQLLHEFTWSRIDCLKFQGQRFEVKADAGEVLVMYTQSVMHSQHLLKHISNNHRLHLHTKHSFRDPHMKEKRQRREMYIRYSTDPDTEESEDELPPMKSYLEKARQLHAATVETVAVAHARDTDSAEIELCVDEPEMFVDDPEEIVQLTELLDLEGVSVDGPPLVAVSEWIDFTMEMKEVLKWRACRLPLDQCRASLEKLYATHLANSSEEHADTLRTYDHETTDITF